VCLLKVYEAAEAVTPAWTEPGIGVVGAIEESLKADRTIDVGFRLEQCAKRWIDRIANGIAFVALCCFLDRRFHENTAASVRPPEGGGPGCTADRASVPVVTAPIHVSPVLRI
jgi:hypothetical protein